MNLPQPTEVERKISEQLARRIVHMARERMGAALIWSEGEVVNDALRGIAALLAEARMALQQANNLTFNKGK